MSNTRKYLAVSLATVFAFTSVGCGQGFRTSRSKATAQAVDVNDQLTKAQSASEEAQKAMAEANAALAEIMDEKGNIHLSLFSSTSDNSRTRTVGLLAPIVDKLKGVFDKLFTKVDLVKQQFTTARTLLNDAMAKLNPADPAQAAQIDMIKLQLAKIDMLEQQFSNSMHLLAGKLDLAVTALDKLIQTGTSMIPMPVPGLGAVAGVLIDLFLTSDVKNLIADVKARLMAV